MTKIKQWLANHVILTIVVGYLLFCALSFWVIVILPSADDSAKKECEAAGGVWLKSNSQCFNKDDK